MKIKDLSKENEATLFEMFDYLCSKVDFGKAALDSAAVVCMNTLFIELKEQTEKFEI